MLKKIVNFVHELYNTNDFVPLSVPKFIGNEKKYIDECIDTTFVSSVGKFVDRFEDDIAKYTGANKAVVCVSGTNALHMSLMLAETIFAREDFTKAQVVEAIKRFIPNFEHEEKGKNLDQKM